MYDWRTLRSSDWFKKAAANWTKMRESWRTWWTVGLFNRWMSSSWSLTQFMSPFLFFTQRHNSFRAETNVLSNVLSLKIKFQLFFSINLYLTKFQKKLFTVWVSSALIFGKTHEFRTHLCFSQIHPLLKKKKKKSTVSVFKNSFWVIMEPPVQGHKSARKRKRRLFLGYQERETPRHGRHPLMPLCVPQYDSFKVNKKGSGGGLEVRGMLVWTHSSWQHSRTFIQPVWHELDKDDAKKMCNMKIDKQTPMWTSMTDKLKNYPGWNFCMKSVQYESVL